MPARLTIMTAAASLAIAGLIAPATTPVSAGEDEFIYVDRMPEIRGEHKRTLSADDENSGHRIVQDLYAEDFEHAVIETYVLAVACAGEPAKAALQTYVVAVKYPPKRPATFELATLHDIYKEVYVEDRNGRVRLYEDVQGREMITLSERFRPGCVPI